MSRTAPPGTSAIALLGIRLRAAREERGSGVREVARRGECSGSLISQIERGRANPSVSTLYAISTALGLSLDDLFSDMPIPGSSPVIGGTAAPAVLAEATHPRVILRPPERRVIELQCGVRWQLLMPSPDPLVEFLEVFYAPGGESSAADHAIRHHGREYSLVLAGCLSVSIGHEHYILRPGDSLAFDSMVSHRFWNAGIAPVRAVWFVAARPPMVDGRDPTGPRVG